MAGNTENRPESGAGAALALMPPPSHGQVIHLHDLDALRLELGKVYRLVRSGKMDSQQGTRLAYLIGELRKLHEATLIEKRIAMLEQLAAGTP